MTNRQDFTEMFKSPKGGWTRKNLAQIGVKWPPVKGWRSRLLLGLDPNIQDPNRPRQAKPNQYDELEIALQAEKTLTAKWYQRISGQIAWQPGEREAISIQMEAQAANVNRLIQQKAASDFAALPQEN